MIPPIVKFGAPILLVCALVTLPRLAVAQMPAESIEAAKKEGEVVFYGAVAVNISKRITDLFEKKYGMAVKHWLGDATEIVNRVVTEARAGRPTFDVTLGNEAVMQALEEKNILAVFDAPAAKGYPKQFRDPDIRMTAWRVLPYGINYNYQNLRAEDAPKTYEDLLLPKWKGKFGIAKYLASVGSIAINRQAPRPNAAKLFTDFFLGAEPQRIFGETGEYVFHPEVDHKFKKDVRDDQIVVMRLPRSEEMESWSRKFREMFR